MAPPPTAPLKTEPSRQTAGVTDRPSRRIAARWRGIPVAGRALLLLLLAVGLLRSVDALREAWQYRPVEIAQIAAQRAGKPLTVLPMRVTERWTDGAITERRVKARWTNGNAFFEPIYFALATDSAPFRPTAAEQCYYFPVHDPMRSRHGRVTHVAQFCFRDGTRRPYASGFRAVVR